MAGPFALGAGDPEAGAHAGAAAGHRLILQARVVIDDVGRFVDDPRHQGGLESVVSFAPLGTGLAAHGGHVRLFTPTADPDLKRMEYRALFTCEGRTYCLDGAKEVRRGSVLRGWAATTTLPCRLHDGDDERGAAVGAGVLHLTPLAFLVQLASFRTLHAATLTAGLQARARFLRFFAGELIDSYVTGGRS